MVSKTVVRWLCTGAIFFLGALDAGAQRAGTLETLKPYRVLLVVDRWKDPASQLITSENDSFQPVAALLRAWSVPCEIARVRTRVTAHRGCPCA